MVPFFFFSSMVPLFFSMVRLSFQGCADELLSNFFLFSSGQISFVGYGVGDSAAEVNISL